MFNLPDFPYKDLSDVLCSRYETADDIYDTNSQSDPVSTQNKSTGHTTLSTESTLLSTDSTILSTDNISFEGNTDLFFNDDNASLFDLDAANCLLENELYIIQPDDNSTIINEPHLLDENTVNQFLLPLQVSSKETKVKETEGPDLLALNSCLICHEIFTNDSSLLDHTISVHASSNSNQENNIDTNILISTGNIEPDSNLRDANNTLDNNNLDTEFSWLVCKVCERVLSTGIEEPNEQLCCNNGVFSKNLHSMFVCDICNGLFADGDALDRHNLTCIIENDQYNEPMQNKSDVIKNGQQEVFFSCDTCDTHCTTAEELKHHAAKHQPLPKTARRPYINNSNKMWNCGSCNQLFATARDLYRHKRGEDRADGAPLVAFVCDTCDKVLGSMCALHTHNKMHKATKPGYPCRVCGRRFNQSGHLAIHMRMHTGERPYPCDLCPKAFKVKVERDDHRRTHTGERPFACPACPKTFTAAARLREHARTHTDQRPYKCEICGAAFRRPYARTVHTLIHTGEKPHECDVCGTAFRRSGDMWKHKRTLHGVQPSEPALKNA